MWIMNVTWPITGLYFGPFALWAYYAMGRPSNDEKKKPLWQSVFVGVTHCGGGCTLGDIIAENLVFYTSVTVGASAFRASLLLDYACAYLLGIVAVVDGI